jgi:hypothetical protein
MIDTLDKLALLISELIEDDVRVLSVSKEDPEETDSPWSIVVRFEGNKRPVLIQVDWLFDKKEG